MVSVVTHKLKLLTITVSSVTLFVHISMNKHIPAEKSALDILHSNFQQHDVTLNSTLHNRALRHCK